MRSRVAAWGVYVGTWAVGIWLAFHPTLRSGFRHLQADPGDTVFNHYVLEHTFRWVSDSHHPGTLWSPPFFAPEPLTLAYSENLLGVAPAYWALRTAFAPVFAYQLWMLLMASLTYASVVTCARRYGASAVWASWAGLVCAFGLPRASQIGHQQLMPLMFAPWAFLAAAELVRRPTLRAWFQLLIALGWQLLTCFYLGWFTVFASAIVIGCGLGLDRGGRWRAWAFVRTQWLVLLGSGAVWAVALGLFFAPYVKANAGFDRPWAECRVYVPFASAWLTPPPGSWLRPMLSSFAHSNANMELWLFPGFAVFIAGAFALFHSVSIASTMRPETPRRITHRRCVAKRRTAFVLVVASVAIALLALRWTKGFTPWQLAHKLIPGAKAIRAVGRIECVVVMLATLGCALLFKRQRLFGALLLAVTVAENWSHDWPHFDPAPFYQHAHTLAARMQPGETYYVTFPPDRDFWEYQLLAMWAGLEANASVVNGYTGRQPLGYPNWERSMTPAELASRMGSSHRVHIVDARYSLAGDAPARHTKDSSDSP